MLPAKKICGARDFAGVDTAAERQGIAWVGTKVPDGCKTPAREHLPHMLLQRRGGSRACVFPHGLREMDVAVPEAGNHSLAGAINDARIGENLDFAMAADCGDDAIGRDDDRIGECRGVRRSVDVAAYEREGLRAGRSACAGSPDQNEKAKRNADKFSVHTRHPLNPHLAAWAACGPASMTVSTGQYQICAFPV